jgi:hypothetical protein
MTAPVPGLKAADDSSAEALLGALKHVAAPELRKHATVYNYWLSIRRGREVPPIRDLDPLEISDVAPFSLLLELVDGGEDAEIRHLGAALKAEGEIGRISEASQPSALSSVAGKVAGVARSREALAFQDMFGPEEEKTRCSVTLLPFSTTGDAVDFVYGLVSVETGVTEVEEAPEPVLEQSEPDAEEALEAAEETASSEPEAVEAPEPVADESVPEVAVEEETSEVEEAPEPLELEEEPAAAKPGFSSKVFDALAGAKGFFGTVASADPKSAPEPVGEEDWQFTAKEVEPDEPPAVVEEAELVVEDAEAVEEVEAVDDEPLPVAEELGPIVELAPIDDEPESLAEEPEPIVGAPKEVADEPEPVAEATIETPRCAMEGTLQSKLEQVRGMAEEAQAAKLRAEAALIDGLSAAYDFALDAEDAPEEYLRLVEAQGLKIQLRAPMAPVVKLAFDGSLDQATIKQFEAVLAWALKQELPRGSLGQRIADEGGIGSILTAKAA